MARDELRGFLKTAGRGALGKMRPAGGCCWLPAPVGLNGQGMWMCRTAASFKRYNPTTTTFSVRDFRGRPPVRRRVRRHRRLQRRRPSAGFRTPATVSWRCCTDSWQSHCVTVGNRAERVVLPLAAAHPRSTRRQRHHRKPHRHRADAGKQRCERT